MNMLEYNLEVTRRCRGCLEQLAGDNVPEVLVYGERDVTEVLYDLAYEIPMRLTTIRECYDTNSIKANSGGSVGMHVDGRKKVIVASLINTEERIRRLRELGVNDERIVVLG